MSSCEIIEGITLHHGDCRDIMRALPADHFDAIFTDPPYGIAFKGEKWDTATRMSSHKVYGAGEPVTGSGTTLQAAAMEGVNAVGCELDKRYIPLIHERFRRGIDAPLDFLI